MNIIFIALSVCILGMAGFLIYRRKPSVVLTEDEASLLKRRRIDNFELRSFLARGDFSTSFEAFDIDRGKSCVVRFLRRELMRDVNLAKPFIYKGERLKGLAERFPGNRFVQHVSLHTTIIDGDQRRYIVTELVVGVSLSKVLERHSRLSHRDACVILTQVIDAVKLAHSERIWMRELHPENIILSLDDSGVLVTIHNVGIAFKDLPPGESAQLRKYYYSPEDIKGEDVDEGSDVYAVAVLAYKLLKGENFDPDLHGMSLESDFAFLKFALTQDRYARTMSLDELNAAFSTLSTSSSSAKDLEWRDVIAKLMKHRGIKTPTSPGGKIQNVNPKILPEPIKEEVQSLDDKGGIRDRGSRTTAWIIGGVAVVSVFAVAGYYYWMKPLPVKPADPVRKQSSEEVTNARQLVENARLASLQVKANELASGLFTTALNKEAEADKLMKDGRYDAAEKAFVESEKYFIKSNEEARAILLKVEMSAAKSEAIKVNAERYSKDSYTQGINAEQKGNQELADQNYVDARKAYGESRDNFITATADAKAAQANNDESILRRDINGIRLSMLKEKSVAITTGANNYSIVPFKLASDKERIGNTFFEIGDKKSLLAARDAFLNAKFFYAKAIEESKENANKNNNKINQAEIVDPDRTQDDAKLKEERDKSLLRDKARNAKASMDDFKKQIEVGMQHDAKYTRANAAEQEGVKAEGGMDYEKAIGRFFEAKNLYVEVLKSQKAKQSDQNEVQKVINKYKKYLEQENAQAIASLMQFSSEEKNGWSDFFNIAQNIEVNVETKKVIVDLNEADAEIQVVITYLDNRNEKQKNQFQMSMHFKKDAAIWNVIQHTVRSSQ